MKIEKCYKCGSKGSTKNELEETVDGIICRACKSSMENIHKISLPLQIMQGDVKVGELKLKPQGLTFMGAKDAAANAFVQELKTKWKNEIENVKSVNQKKEKTALEKKLSHQDVLLSGYKQEKNADIHTIGTLRTQVSKIEEVWSAKLKEKDVEIARLQKIEASSNTTINNIQRRVDDLASTNSEVNRQLANALNTIQAQEENIKAKTGDIKILKEEIGKRIKEK